jgi:hypothetical protein
MVITGDPRVLTSGGAIGAAFDTEDVAFAPDLGRFELKS